MKKRLLVFLFALVAIYSGAFASDSPTLAELTRRIQLNPQDTAHWLNLQNWFDTTSLQPERLGIIIDQLLHSISPESDGLLRAELLRHHGVACMDAGDFQQSSGRLLEALRLFEALADARGIANVQVNLGALNYHLSQLSESVRYWEQAAVYFERHGPANRLGVVYSNLGAAFNELEKLDSAEMYHRKALDLHRRNRDMKGMARAWNNLGVTFEYAKKYDRSLACYRQARALCDSLHDIGGVVRAVLNGATILEYQGKYAAALAEINQALQLMPQSRDKVLYRLAYMNLAGVYSKMGRYKEAYESLGTYHAYKDSLVNEENTQYIQSLAAQYESEKKEKEIALLNRESETQALRLQQQRLLLAGLLAMALLLGALVWTVMRNQRRTDQLLHNILPVPIASELRHTGRVQPRRHEAATVLFADLAGFTELGRTLPPEKLIGLIDRYYRAFDVIIARYGIEKIKTIGDSYMCAGGVPEANAQHAQLVFRAGTEMLQWVRDNAAEENHHLEVRIGIHSGPVVAGVVGQTKYAYDIWGDTVNTAARMEQFGVPGRINLSEATRQLLSNEVKVQPREPVEVKGIGLMRMYLAE